MKTRLKLFLLFVICFPVASFSQQNPKFVYCEIVGQSKLFSTKVNIIVDFGEKLSFWTDIRMKDESGKPLVFNSMVDALNFMGKRGWQFAQAYAVTLSQNINVYHYLMQKPFDELDEEAKKEFLKN